MVGENTNKRSQGSTEYLLILAVVLVVAAIAVYYVSRGPSFPPLSATEAKQDNEIRINVESGSIAAGDWQYKIKNEDGQYLQDGGSFGATETWISGAAELKAPYASLGTFTSDNYWVSLRHRPSGHIYFADRAITIE